MYYTLLANEVADTAQRAIEALNSLGYKACIVGSLACNGWGMNHRTPQDVDIVVLDTSPGDEARLKREIVARDPQFCLVNPKSPFATYKVLWHRTAGFGRKCKVDILATGTLNIPNVPVEYIVQKPIESYHLPVMPFIPLLCLKVQAWAHHRVADKLHLRAKVTRDYFDIQELLRIAKENGYRMKIEGRQVAGLKWMPRSFVDIAKQHVKLYATSYPESLASWNDVML